MSQRQGIALYSFICSSWFLLQMEGVATVDTSKHQMGEITQGVSLHTVRKRMRIEPLGMLFSFKEQSGKTKKKKKIKEGNLEKEAGHDIA